MKHLSLLLLCSCATAGFAGSEGSRPLYALLLNGGGPPSMNHDGAAADALGVTRYPTFIVFDDQGPVLARKSGSVPTEVLQ